MDTRSQPAFSTMTVDSLIALMNHWATAHDIPEPASPTQTFADAGFDSLHSLELAFFLEDKVGVVLDETILYNYPTFDALARYLMERSGLTAVSDDTGQESPTQIAGQSADW